MTTIYVPRLIESAEQAETLPEETIAYLLHDDGFTDGLAMRLTQSADDPRAWQVMGRFPLATHRQMVGWTALVPIEAEEEQVAVAKASDGTETCYNPDAASHHVFGGYIGSLPIRTRLVTPWEAV